ncbi:hypothetical protein D3C78_1062860 [compost metagenome]
MDTMASNAMQAINKGVRIFPTISTILAGLMDRSKVTPKNNTVKTAKPNEPCSVPI